MDWLNIDLAYTVVSVIVVAVFVVVAYARGYSSGHADGYVEASLRYADAMIKAEKDRRNR